MSYSAWMVLAALASLLWAAARSTSRRGLGDALNAHALAAGCAALLGRVFFAGLNDAYFAEHPAEILDFARTPGFSVQGALIGFLLALMVLNNRPAWRDGLAVAPLLAGLAASLGCIDAGCGAGREVFWTDGALWALRVDWPDAILTRAPRLPSQGLLALWLLASLAVLRVWRPNGPNWLAAAAAGLCAAGDLLTQFTRAESAFFWSGLAIEQWLDVAILCAFVALVFLHTRPANGRGSGGARERDRESTHSHATHARASVPD